MEIIYIDSKYTDYLRKYDSRVSFNENITYQRPYIGVLLKVQDKKYFAPLTTSGKWKKLKDNPKPENVTFLPICNCRYGGINFNNMLPVVGGTYFSADLEISSLDDDFIKNKKLVLQKIEQFSRKNNEKIIIKAKNLYNLKIKNKLYPNYDAITCDFKKLEEVASNYKPAVKTSLQNPIAEKYGLTEEQYDIAEKFAEKFGKPLEQVIRSNIAFAPDSHYDSSIKSNVITEEATKRQQKNKTQEKNISKPVAVKTKKSSQDQNSR